LGANLRNNFEIQKNIADIFCFLGFFPFFFVILRLLILFAAQ